VTHDPATVLPPDYLAWLRGLAAERRFGDGDRLGTVNHIDDAARARARAAITTGVPVSLARPLQPGPNQRQDERPAFALEVFTTDGPIAMGSDHVELDCHGRDNTHVDGLNHIGLDGTWYGGHAYDDPAAPSIAELAEAGIFTRGVHVDIPAVRGTGWVDPDEPVTGADLDRALAGGGLTFEPGDALLLDMGRDRYEAAGHEWVIDRNPGIGDDGARWIADHGVSVVCWDFLDAFHPDQPLAPVHMLNWAIGLVLVDNCDFARLRTDPGSAGGTATTGALAIAPLPIAGATGNNVNPLLVR
jgi:kynurenine formamidase